MKFYLTKFSLSIAIFFLVILFTSENLAGQSKFTSSKENLVHLRLELSTTSDWTILRWNKFANIKTMRVFAVEGKNPEFQVFYNQIKLTQKSLNRNETSKIIVDYLIKVNQNEKWNYSLLRGSIGGTRLRLLVLKDLLFEEIYSFNHDKIIKEDLGENKVHNEINFRFDSSFVIKPIVTDSSKIPKLILAFYYLWYTKDNWEIFPLNDKPENIYSSSDEKIIKTQIRLAKSSGIDGFISSWDGPGTYSDQNFNKFLKLCKENNFKTAIYYETLTAKGPRDDEEIFQHLKYIIQKYGKDPSLIKIFDKPLIVIWASNEINITKWRKILNRLKIEKLDATFIGMGYDISNLEVFDGIHQYGVILIENLEKENKQLSEIVKNYHLLGSNRKIWIATAQPGYDERKIPGRPGFFIDRKLGKYYEETISAAISSNPDLIFITSWNEWWEHTHIEPSKKHKNLYLNITKKYARLWKTKR